VCVLERDMMIASCHGGIREGGLQRRWIALALNSPLREMGVHIASGGCTHSVGGVYT
jgi:hypothetical protein